MMSINQSVTERENQDNCIDQPYSSVTSMEKKFFDKEDLELPFCSQPSTPYVELTPYEKETREQLVKRWRKLFKSTPAKNLSLPMMRRIIGYELQCRKYGGLSKAVKAALKAPLSMGLPISQIVNPNCPMKLKDDGEDNQLVGKETHSTRDPYYTSKERSKVSYLKPGTQLLREWHGRTYRIEVTESGFLMDGKSYKSLTAIAMRITGTRWSGPRFFGLRTRGVNQIDVTATGTKK